MRQFQRFATLWLMCLLAGLAKAQDVTATWDFNDETIANILVASSLSTESDTILSNNIALVVEANGNAIEKAENGIKTEDGVTFKVQVKSNLDVVTVKGGEDFAYTIGGKAVKKAKTSYTAKDDDVKNGYVTIINNGGNLLSINVVQKEAPKPLDPPSLDSLIINGTKFAADSLFGNAIKGQLVLDFDEPMVSEKNPVSTVVKAGQVDLITYTGDDTKCTVVIEMSNGDQTVKYTLDITQKPSVVLTYYDSDGITVLGKSRREKGKTIEHFDFGADDVTVEEGFKMRGWYHEPEGGLKYTLDEKVGKDISLYAMTTAIEEVSNSAIYNFDLTDIYFDPDNHEAFNPKGKGFYWYDDIHGWAFKNDNQIDLLVGPRATISLKLCQENYAKDSIIVISQAGDTLSILSPKVEEDGDLVNYLYEGEGGTLTLKIKTSGEVTIHSVRIMNTAEANYVNVGNWYIVNPDDGKSFLDVIRIANSLNTTKNAERIYVFLPKGTYDLGNTVEATISAYNVSIIGQSADSTIIVTTPDYEVEGLGTSDLIKNTSSNLYLQDLTLKNAFDYYNNRSQGAAAVLNDQGDHTIGKNVRMLSHESTYYCMNNRTQSYWEDCDIHGVFDFICGGGDIRIQNSTLSLEPRFTNGGGTRVIVTPRTLTKFGYVFDNCKVVDLADGKGEWSFGRTWSNQPIAVYLNTTLDEYAENTLISTRWTEEGRTATDPLVFGEFNTMDSEGTNITPETNTIRIKSSFQTILTASQAAEFSYEKMFSANAEKKWDPAKLTEQVAAPADANYVNGSVTWTAVDGYRLSIRSANAMGGFGPEGHVAGTTGIQTVKRVVDDDVIYNLQGVRVKNPGKGIYIINGKKTILK